VCAEASDIADPVTVSALADSWWANISSEGWEVELGAPSYVRLLFGSSLAPELVENGRRLSKAEIRNPPDESAWCEVVGAEVVLSSWEL
jgi:hypothetical protein